MLVPILFLVFCFISPFIVLNLLNRNNPYVKKTKRCTQSIEAHITDTDYINVWDLKKYLKMKV